MSKTCGIIIAAGESSRTWPLNANGKKHKASLILGGISILERTIKSLMQYVDEVVVVISPEHNWSFQEVNPLIAYQPVALSTADAIIKGYEKCKDAEEYIIVNGYHAFADNILSKIIEKKGNVLALTETREPNNYGIAKIKNNKVIEIIEKPKNNAPSNMRVIGIYKLKNEVLNYLSLQNLQSPHVFEEALTHFGKTEGISYISIDKSPLSLKYPWHYLDFMNNYLNTKIGAFIHKDAEVAPTAVIKGKVFIESGAKIMDYAVIQGPAYIGENAIIGNFSLIRESVIEKDALIGAHTEVARSLIQPGASAHRAYIGDSVIDKDVKLGAGFISANRLLSRKEIQVMIKEKIIKTGKTNLGCFIGENTVIGVNSSTMPGTLVNANLKIKPYSMLKGNVYDIHNI